MLALEISTEIIMFGAPFSSELGPRMNRGLARERRQPGDGAACLLSMVQARD